MRGGRVWGEVSVGTTARYTLPGFGATVDRNNIFLQSEYVTLFSNRRRHTRDWRDWSSDVCSSDLKRQRVAERHVAVVLLFIVPRLVNLVAIDRKSVVQGKSVDLGGRRIIKKKK